MTDDDWAPLPESDLGLRPGESVELKKRELPPPPAAAAAAPPPAGAVAAAVKPKAEPLTPEQEQLLAALRAKVAASGEAQSLVAAARKRRAKEERKARAAADPTLSATVVTAADPFARPVVEYDPGVDGRDEREESEWFQGLPAKEQDRLRAAWGNKRAHAADLSEGQRHVRNRRFVAACVVFVATMFLGTGIYWHATLGAGIVCGLWWRHAPADRFLDPGRALLCLFGMQSVAMLVHREVNMTLFMDSIVLVALAAIVGFDGEIRRTGGFDVR